MLVNLKHQYHCSELSNRGLINAWKQEKNKLFLAAIQQTIWHSLGYPMVKKLSANYAEFPYQILMAQAIHIYI